jgi:Fur family transcriptional regulator, ferric uptake regulator
MQTQWHSWSVTRDATSAAAPAPAGTRDTRQRRAVLEVLDGEDGFRSAQAIHATLRDSGVKIGLATVYRSLNSLSEAGSVDVLRDGAGEQLFRRCGGGSHHHHLVCRACGTTVEVESDSVETWAARVGREHGFFDVQHTIEVFGTCPACATPAAPPAR